MGVPVWSGEGPQTSGPGWDNPLCRGDQSSHIHHRRGGVSSWAVFPGHRCPNCSGHPRSRSRLLLTSSPPSSWGPDSSPEGLLLLNWGSESDSPGLFRPLLPEYQYHLPEELLSCLLFSLSWSSKFFTLSSSSTLSGSRPCKDLKDTFFLLSTVTSFLSFSGSTSFSVSNALVILMDFCKEAFSSSESFINLDSLFYISNNWLLSTGLSSSSWKNTHTHTQKFSS